MIYCSENKDLCLKLKYTVEKLIANQKKVLDLFAIMEHFMQVNKRVQKPASTNFLDFMQSQVPL